MVSGLRPSAPPPPSTNTSLAPAGPGDMTRDGRGGGATKPAKLEDEPLPPGAGSPGWAGVPWLPGGGEEAEEEEAAAVASLSLSRSSSEGFCSALPSLG